jgi:hypothetical protein
MECTIKPLFRKKNSEKSNKVKHNKIRENGKNPLLPFSLSLNSGKNFSIKDRDPRLAKCTKKIPDVFRNCKKP